MNTAEKESHRHFLASLTAEQRSHLTEKTNTQGVLRLVIHAGLILLLMAMVTAEVSFRYLLYLPLGILLVFLFTLLHETIHRTAFKSRRLNDVVAKGCGWLLFLPPAWFRYFHFEHHRHTQHPDKDPELATPKPQTMRQYLWQITGLPVTFAQLKTLLVNARGQNCDGFVPENGQSLIQRESRVMLASYVALVLISLILGFINLLFYCWWLPLILGQPFLRLYLMAEHGRCPLVSNMFLNTRTVFTNRVIRALAWNMPFHAEHHAYPSVPFHRLPQLHLLVKQKLQVTSDGYTGFHRETVKQHLQDAN